MTLSKGDTSQTDFNQVPIQPDGSFKRAPSAFRSTIERGGHFDAESDRYHLYASLACPWATRTLITRSLKGLQDIIPVTIVSPRMGAQGWSFANVDEFPGADVDPLYGSQHIKDLYFKAEPQYSGRFTVPVLWDKKTETIVNNESSEIIRIFNSAFNHLLPEDKAAIDVYPEEHHAEINQLNTLIYDNVNNGVYKAGMAKSQEAYQNPVQGVFDMLDKLEVMLTGKDYLVGDRLTEADIRLWVTLIRFDPVYVGHFKCNLRTIRHGYPALNLYTRRLYWNNEAFKANTNFDHIKTHYYWSHISINPTRVVPVGPIPSIEPL